MPQYQPPAQYPVEQYQTQNQQQELPVNIENNNEAETSAKSKAENSNQLEGSMHNVQVNNNQSGYYQYERGIRMPTTTLNLTGWADDMSHGGSLTLSIPLGGSKGKYAKRQINARIREVEVDTVARELSACANIDAAGFEIIDYEALGLTNCQFLRKVSRTPVQNAKDELNSYIDQINKQQRIIESLMKRLDEMSTERGTEFKTPG